MARRRPRGSPRRPARGDRHRQNEREIAANGREARDVAQRTDARLRPPRAARGRARDTLTRPSMPRSAATRGWISPMTPARAVPDANRARTAQGGTGPPASPASSQSSISRSPQQGLEDAFRVQDIERAAVFGPPLAGRPVQREPGLALLRERVGRAERGAHLEERHACDAERHVSRATVCSSPGVRRVRRKPSSAAAGWPR